MDVLSLNQIYYLALQNNESYFSVFMFSSGDRKTFLHVNVTKIAKIHSNL